MTGARNGSVKLFDIRAPPTSHCTIFQPCVRTGRLHGVGWDTLAVPSSQRRRNTPSPSKPLNSRPAQVKASTGHASAVTNLRVVNEWGLLLAAMDGTVSVFDGCEESSVDDATTPNCSWLYTIFDSVAQGPNQGRTPLPSQRTALLRHPHLVQS